MGISLCNAMMSIKHPANPCFLLFLLKDNCYIITCLKSVDSLSHAMIAALLPSLKWMLEAKHGRVTTMQVPKWFKPTACLCAVDAYLDPTEECVWNKSDEMLNLAISDSDTLYWESTWLNQWHPNKRKVMDSLSTVKMAISPIKMHKLKAMTTTQLADKLQGRTANTTDTQTVASQISTITQLTKQVSILQPAQNEIDSKQQQHTFPILMQSCWKPWPDIMTTLCSWQCGWFLHAQHSTQAN